MNVLYILDRQYFGSTCVHISQCGATRVVNDIPTPTMYLGSIKPFCI